MTPRTIQASIVQLTAGTIRVYGANNFPASVLVRSAWIGRPPSGSPTSPTSRSAPATLTWRRHPELLDSRRRRGLRVLRPPAAADRAATIFDSNPWRKLSANRDNRVYVVNNEIWQTGEGLIAARGIVDDLRLVNAPIN